MKKVFCIIGILIGIFIMYLGFGITQKDIGLGSSLDTHITFGADFYTYEYEATARAANAVKNVGWYIEDVFNSMGFFIISIGGVVVCYFGCVLTDTMKKNPVALPTTPTPGTQADELPDL